MGVVRDNIFTISLEFHPRFDAIPYKCHCCTKTSHGDLGCIANPFLNEGAKGNVLQTSPLFDQIRFSISAGISK